MVVQVVNNFDWYQDMTFLGFLRDVGKHARMGTMLNKDSVKTRLAGDTGMSFTEFSYQLLQVSTAPQKSYDCFIYLTCLKGQPEQGRNATDPKSTLFDSLNDYHGMLFLQLTESLNVILVVEDTDKVYRDGWID